MTKEEVLPYATKLTFSNQATVVLLKNGIEIIGYFEGNSIIPDNNNLNKDNKWYFKTFPLEKDNTIIINGNDIESIKIIFKN